MNYRNCVVVGSVLMFVSGCSPKVSLPPAQEPLDSAAWVDCAAEAEEKQSMSMIADLNKDGKALLCRGVTLSRQPGKTDEALELLNEAAGLDKTDHRAYYVSGRILAEAGRYEESLSAFASAARRYPSMEVPSERLGRSILDKKGLEEAVTFVEKAQKRELCNYGCKGLLASLYIRKDKVDEAVAIYKGMIETQKDEPAAYVGLGRAYNASGDHSKEAATLSLATKTSGFTSLPGKTQGNVLFNASFAHYSAQEYEQAKIVLDKALLLENKPMWIVLSGWIHAKLGDPAMALVKFEKALAKDDNMSAAHVGRGDSLSALNRFEDAKVAYKKGIELDGGNLVASLKLAKVLVKLGDVDGAEQIMKKLEDGNSRHLPAELVKEVASAIADSKTE